MGEFVIYVGMTFLIQVSYVFECLFMPITVWINFGNHFGHRGIKNWDFKGKNGVFPESITAGHRHNSPRPVRGDLGVNSVCENSPRE